MSRRKKTSSMIITTATARTAAMESIDPKLDLGHGLTLAGFKQALNDTHAKLSSYNTLLSQLDDAHNSFAGAELRLRELNERMLAGVAARFGRDSSQYEMAGGTRKSERKRPVRKVAAPLAA